MNQEGWSVSALAFHRFGFANGIDARLSTQSSCPRGRIDSKIVQLGQGHLTHVNLSTMNRIVEMALRLWGVRAALIVVRIARLAVPALLIATHLLRFIVGAVIIFAVAGLAVAFLWTSPEVRDYAAYFIYAAIGVYALWEIKLLVQSLNRDVEPDPSLDLPSVSRREIPPSVKQVVYYRDKGRCRQCGHTDTLDLEYDYIIPLSKGGGNEVENVQLLCQACIQSKPIRSVYFQDRREPEQDNNW